MAERSTASALEVRGLHVYYGQSHALQGVDLILKGGVLSVVGRNGMGKTTLCKAIMGMVPVSSGSITFGGQNLVGKTPGEIARMGVGYVPQGRRLWRSLSVDEHLRLMARPRGAWSVDRIYATFPRLAERKNNGGAQLSGGEQQMLAISRALLLNPKLLVMDEPTEGLAPVIVDQVADMLLRIGSEGDIDVLVIEQNIGVATSVAEDVAVMVNGRVSRRMESRLLASDKELQQRLLGVGRHGHDAEPEERQQAGAQPQHQQRAQRIYLSNPTLPTRWSKLPSARFIENAARTVTAAPTVVSLASVAPRRSHSVADRIVVVAGAMKRRGHELRFIAALLKEEGIPTRLIDLSGRDSGADLSWRRVENMHPQGRSDGLQSDYMHVPAASASAFERAIRSQGEVAGAIALAGLNDGVALASGLEALPAGTPRLLMCPAAALSTAGVCGSPDLTVLHLAGETYGLSDLNRPALRSGALAIAGMARARLRRQLDEPASRRVLALTRYAGTETLAERIATGVSGFDVLGFAADGIGSFRLSTFVGEGKVDVLADLSMIDIADFVCGGSMPSDRLVAVPARYLGVCGGLDMIRLDAHAATDALQRGRKVIQLAPGLSVMRVNADEAAAVGRYIGARLNEIAGSVQLFLPEGGLSEAGRSGGVVSDPGTDNILFTAIERTVRRTSSRQIVRLPVNVNDPEMANAVLFALGGEDRPVRVATGRRR